MHKESVMQVSVEKTGDLERRMTVQVPADDIDSRVAGRLNELRREVRLKGFRPGKVPINVIRQRYGKQVREEVLSQVMQSSLEQAIGEQDMRVAGVTRLEPTGEGSDAGFEFIAELEVFPDLPEIAVDDLEIEKPVAEVVESDIDDMIETLREQRRQWHEADRPATDGDRVRLSYVAELDGQRIPETGRHEIAPTVGALESFPDLQAALEGASSGEEKTVELTFPENYRHESLAGKTAQVELKVQKIEYSELPEVDDEFAAAFGVEEGVEKLRADVRRNLERELRAAVTNRLKQSVTDKLLGKYADLPLPASSLQQEMRQMQAQVQAQARQQGNEANVPGPEAFRESAERRLRLGLLFGEFARQSGIQIDPARIQAKLEEVAETYENPSQIIEIYRSDERLMDQMENIVLEEQVVDALLERANVSEKQMSFKQALEQE
ncbi:MAG: trigger factor [Wenzhouxiangella sp.]|nr:MAG: trigger factor [Wenzhouxiangella sp.]